MLKIKREYCFTIFFLSFIFALLIFSESNLVAAKDGLILWVETIIPTLFPFFVATELLCNTNLVYFLGKYLGNIVKFLFNVPGEGIMALSLGIISGYPTGAKVIVNLKEKNILNKEEAERLLSFTNNSGSLFILGTIGLCFLNNKILGYILLITHILASLTVGIIFRNWKKDKVSIRKETSLMKNVNLNFNDLGELLGNSVKKAIGTVLNIGGFVVLFSVIISILEKSNVFLFIYKVSEALNINGELIVGMIKGIIEVTNGAKIVSLQGFSVFNIALLAFILGLGGISVMLQVYSIVSKENISIRPYIYGKFLQGIFAFAYTSIFLLLFTEI